MAHDPAGMMQWCYLLIIYTARIHLTEGVTYGLKNDLCGSSGAPFYVQPLANIATVSSENGAAGGYYSPNIDCTAAFQAPSGYIIRLTFTFMEMSAGCNDWVKIYDGQSVDADLLSNLCGAGYPKLPQPSIFTSSAAAITVRFKSDGRADDKQGFQFQYERIKESALASGLCCYTCTGCTVRNYLGLPDTVSIAGCHSCFKLWDTRLSTATRGCHNTGAAENSYIANYASGVTAINGCQNVTSNSGYVIEYCVCRDDNCNSQTVSSLDVSLFMGICILSMTDVFVII